MTIRTKATSVALLTGVLALGVAACGDDERPAAKAPADAVAAQSREMPDKAPAAITCGDLADKVRSARMSRRASNLLAAEASVSGLTQLQASQSIYFAMTELCKREEPGFRPAEPAVRAVEAGRYRADLGTP